MNHAWLWGQLVLLGVMIAFAGYQLSRYADEIAHKTGLGRNWIGTILLATVTSLPELMSGISAVRGVNDPNLAVGDILGSCVINLSLVVVLDFIYREGIVYKKATQGHLLSAGLGIVLISFVAFGLLVSHKLPGFTLGHVGGFTAMIPIAYFLAMHTIFRFERSAQIAKPAAPSERELEKSLPRIYSYFALASLVVVLCGIALPFVAHKIVVAMDWNSAFVGTIFLALATSLPEIVVTVSAIRLRAVELAFSNVLGSNLFNIVILTVDDLFYAPGPIFRAVDPSHAVTAISAVMMTGLVFIALLLPPQKKILNIVSGLSLMILGLFLLNTYVMFVR